jgi:hypothetical protein
VTANCFGKVISHEAQEQKDPTSGEERLGAHARDPLPGDADNETPRQGIGNQDQYIQQHTEPLTHSLTMTMRRT